MHVCISFLSGGAKGFCVLSGQLPSWLAIPTMFCSGNVFPMLFNRFWFSWHNKLSIFFLSKFSCCFKYKSCNIYQVHHGGAGTTAAGLKAAVTIFASLEYLFLLCDLLQQVYCGCFYVFCFSVQQQLYHSLETNHSGERGCMPEESVQHPSRSKHSRLKSWLMPFISC